MKNYLKHDEWCIVEEGFNREYNKITESIFSLGNGRMGQRANFEEQFSGETLQGNYVAGVYYPDKTRVGWWKNGYPEYFAKVLNAPNWIGIFPPSNSCFIRVINSCNIASLKCWSRIIFFKIGTLPHGSITNTE